MKHVTRSNVSLSPESMRLSRRRRAKLLESQSAWLTGGRKDSRNEGARKLLDERKERLAFRVLYHFAKLSDGAQQRHRRLGKQLSDLPPGCELPCKLYCFGCPMEVAHQMPNGHCPSNYSRVRQGCRCWKVRWACPLLYSPAQRSFLPARTLGRPP